MSKSVIELALENASADVEVYNLNDGAKIRGTIPLELQNILILSDSRKKANAVEWLENTAHQTLDKQVFKERFNEKINVSDLLHGFSLLEKVMSKPFKERADAEKAIISNRKIIIEQFRDGKPIVIYYLHGSVNYVNTALSNTLNMANDEECVELLNRIREQWMLFLADASLSMKVAPYELDFISGCPLERAQVKGPEYYKGHRLVAFSESAGPALAKASKILGINFSDFSPTCGRLRIEFYKTGHCFTSLKEEKLCLIVTSLGDFKNLLARDSNALILYLPQYFNDENYDFGVFDNKVNYVFFIALLAATCSESVKVVVPKLLEKRSFNVLSEYLTEFASLSTFISYESHYYTAFSRKYLSEKEMVNGVDERFRFLPSIREENLFLVF